VQDELEFVEGYLELQGLRFGNALSVQWELNGSDWHAVASPPLLFHPLVENAVRHGVEAGDDQGEITISLGKTLTHVILRITNSIPNVPVVDAGHGIGLTATRERLALLYGDLATLQFGSSEQHFTMTLSYPIRDWNSSVERTNC
jgi:two-component system sensor histidine kinase AlgZ